MTIFGIDPGIATVGYGAVSYDGTRLKLIEYGTVTTPAGMPVTERLCGVYDGITALLERLKPDSAAIEELFFNTNTTTAISVAQARGVLLLATHKCAVPAYEYTPLQIKQAVTGYGRAEKRQVMDMVRMFLNLEKIPRPDDAADALAVAICHCHSAGSSLFAQENL